MFTSQLVAPASTNPRRKVLDMVCICNCIASMGWFAIAWRRHLGVLCETFGHWGIGLFYNRQSDTPAMLRNGDFLVLDRQRF